MRERLDLSSPRPVVGEVNSGGESASLKFCICCCEVGMHFNEEFEVGLRSCTSILKYGRIQGEVGEGESQERVTP